LTPLFTIIVDTRETAAYGFERSSYTQLGRVPFLVAKRREYLPTGDYSIDGLKDLVTVERKSLPDLFSTLGQNRERFKAEHERMAEMAFAAVVIEASWYTITKLQPAYSQLDPNSVHGTAVSWMQRYGVPWIAACNRELAEETTFRLLERFWIERTKRHRPCQPQTQEQSQCQQ